MRDPGAITILVGLSLVVATVAFPAWSLVGYTVTVTEVAAPPDDATPVDGETLRHEQTRIPLVEFEELDARSQALVESGLEADGHVTVYGPSYTHQSTNGDLPAIVEDAWLDDYGLGGYVVDDGTYYEVSAGVHSEPLFLPVLIAAGVVAGLVVASVGAVVLRRGGPGALAHVASVVGFALLLGLAWFGNVHGYV